MQRLSCGWVASGAAAPGDVVQGPAKGSKMDTLNEQV